MQGKTLTITTHHPDHRQRRQQRRRRRSRRSRRRVTVYGRSLYLVLCAVDIILHIYSAFVLLAFSLCPMQHSLHSPWRA